MRFRKIAVVFLVTVLGLIVLLAGCGKGTATTATTQLVAIQRGDITTSITGTGNLALARTADLTFDVAGTVLDIMAEEGDSVTEGEVLASLDTSQWEDQLNTLEKALVTAQRNFKNAERQISARELSVRQAELDLKSVEEDASSIPAVQAAQLDVDNAKAALQNALDKAASDPVFWGSQIVYIQQRLTEAEANLKSVLAGTSFSLSSDVALQIQRTQLKVEMSQRQLEDARIAVDDAIQARDDAEQAVSDAQKALDDAQALSPEIKAPFDGFITMINVAGGDEVKKGAVAMQIAEPDKFEADILVSENDIFDVSLDSNATVQVDSLSSLSLPATVTYIAPTATTQQGVVNYRVRVEVQSVGRDVQQQRPSGFGQSGNFSIEQFAERLQQAVEQGRMTQEQADQILEQMKSGAMPDNFGQSGPTGQTPPFSQAGAGDFHLKQGLSVTVNIITAQKTNVLLVPNDAISRQGGGNVVTVRKNGVNEQKPVVTGISDWQYTEVISGLEEGDEVVITRSGSSSSSFDRGGFSQFGGFGGQQRVVVR